MPGRKTHLLKEIGKEDTKNYRGFKPVVPQRIFDRLPADVQSNLTTDEALEHQAWLDKITENVNRRLGNR